MKIDKATTLNQQCEGLLLVEYMLDDCEYLQNRENVFGLKRRKPNEYHTTYLNVMLCTFLVYVMASHETFMCATLFTHVCTVIIMRGLWKRYSR